jgi:aminoglycoside 3-N-acetyltransferase
MRRLWRSILNIDKILSLSPWIEVIIKTLYWRVPTLNKLLAARARSQNKVKVASKLPAISFDMIDQALKDSGVLPGDILIVHSSAVALSRTGLSPVEICQKLLNFLGTEGTLAAPAIPLFREEPTGSARLTDEICSKRLKYDVKRTPPWTGAIAKALMGMPGSVRSRHPLNSMVAIGKHAVAMMEKNIDGNLPTACGINSSWKYCSDRNAKIVFLGVDASHNMTMIHVAEDAWESQWPVNGWYRERLFTIRDSGVELDITVRERCPKWSIYYGERTLQRDLQKFNVLKYQEINGFKFGYCESGRLIDFLNDRKSKSYPYWIPLWIVRGGK